MIWESSTWKNELLRAAGELTIRKSQRRWSVTAEAKLERTVLTGFWTIRKLAEAHKFSTEIFTRQVPLIRFPFLGKRIDYLNCHRFNELYNFNRPLADSLPVSALCNQFIHSFVFSVALAETGGLVGIFFNSDRTRRRGVYEIDVDRVVSLFTEIAENDPSEVHMKRETNGQVRVWVGPTMQEQ